MHALCTWCGADATGWVEVEPAVIRKLPGGRVKVISPPRHAPSCEIHQLVERSKDPADSRAEARRASRDWAERQEKLL